MIEIIQQILTYLISNYALYLVITMGAIVSLTIGTLSLIKRPIKMLTKKIKNDKLRKLVNKIFIFIAFGLSLAFWTLLHIIAPHYFTVDAVEVVLTGALSVVMYALGDGVITKSKAQQLVDAIIDNTNDKKANTEDKSAIREYLKKVK